MYRYLSTQEVAGLIRLTEFVWLCEGVDKKIGKKDVRFDVLSVRRSESELRVQVDVGSGEVFWITVLRWNEKVAEYSSNTKAA